MLLWPKKPADIDWDSKLAELPPERRCQLCEGLGAFSVLYTIPGLHSPGCITGKRLQSERVERAVDAAWERRDQ